jgi:phosphate transport system permease protein
LLSARKRKEKLFQWVCRLCATLSIVFVTVLIIYIAYEGLSTLNWNFIVSFPSRYPHKAGIWAGLAGSLWIIALTAMISIPVGVGTAVYLEEYKIKGRLGQFIEINIANLAGVPSIVYGMLGLGVFVLYLNLGRSILAGALTMSLLVLPIIIIASKEAVRAVPNSIRYAAYAMGATRWQVIWGQVLPAAIPGIMTGVILALSRAIGETAPLIVVGAFTYVTFTPEGIMDEFTTLPIQIFNWASRPQADFHQLAATGSIVLLSVLLFMNAIAVWIRHRSQGKNS